MRNITVIAVAAVLLVVGCSKPEPDWYSLGALEFAKRTPGVSYDDVEPGIWNREQDCVGVIVDYPDHDVKAIRKATIFFREGYFVGIIRGGISGGQLPNPMFPNCHEAL